MTGKSELTPSEDRYRQLLDAAPDAIVVIGNDETITLVNLQTEKLFEYSRSELLGQPLELLIPERFRGSHEGHLARFFKSPVLRPMGSGLELFGRRKDGTEIPIEVSLSPVSSAAGMSVSAAIRDITERKRIEGVAKTLAVRLASAVESIEDSFALFDGTDRLVLCNSGYRSLLAHSLTGSLVGLSYAELLDAWLTDLEFTSDEERVRFRQERLAARREAEAGFEVQTRDGRTLRVMDRRTAEGGIVKTIWNLTEDVQRAQELREARGAAEAASAAKSEFLSSMSHELRTPLNAILGFAQLLQRDKKEPLSERHRARAEQILKGGEHLLRLIDDILDLSRIEAGRVSISKEPVNVVEVVQEVAATLDATATRSGISLEVLAFPAEVPMVAVDRTRFAQILMNYGSNAIKYNRPGGVARIAVSVPSGEFVRITVADTGIGVPVDKQDKLFQPFQRAGQETGPIEGTGIGLVITKRLTELMGGRVGFRSTAGKGSEFWADFPVHALRPRAIPPPLANRTMSQFDDGPRRQVLYVEDNPANVAFIRDLLGTFDNIDLLTAPTAEMGVALAHERKLDVVIMDINLPGMSGVDALNLLRRDPRTKDIPVIALTAAASERDKQRGMKAGFYSYLTKPVKVDELIGALESLLARPV